MAGRSTAAMRAARAARPKPHTRSSWCECLACYAGQLALRLPPTAPVARPYDVPADRLVRGPGERRVCAHDSDCLDEWVRGPHADDEAHCPPGCARYAPVDRREYLYAALVRRHDSDDQWPDASDLSPGPRKKGNDGVKGKVVDGDEGRSEGPPGVRGVADRRGAPGARGRGRSG